eukprot:TRINITY_DN51565_c0_g1_i1.p1 TRINITY_DN51565_c0_g1~~TRINITY_DN51565_c0_g1_i1.p1  ORF type:complete len:323 (+),score=50.77 TRINITY_DN51565_c0_g1_i1:205-1173(+)
MAWWSFDAVKEGLITSQGLDEVFTKLLESPAWKEYETRTTKRHVDSWTFNGDTTTPPPPHLRFAEGLVRKLIARLQEADPHDEIVPFQAFLCMYEDGNSACPNHRHDCRQLTLAMGDDRDMFVDGQRIRTKHGDCLVLDGEEHGVPAQRSKSCNARASINLFYSTRNDIASYDVDVNHKPGSTYKVDRLGSDRPRVAKGGAKGSGRDGFGGKGSYGGGARGGAAGHGKESFYAAGYNGSRQDAGGQRRTQHRWRQQPSRDDKHADSGRTWKPKREEPLQYPALNEKAQAGFKPEKDELKPSRRWQVDTPQYPAMHTMMSRTS